MYKASEYNIFITDLSDNEKLYYNSFTGAVCIIDRNCLRLINEITEIDTNDLRNTEKEHLATLIENGFIVNQEFDELNWLLIRNKGLRFNLDSNRLRLTIAPTMACNFRCYYCYESKAKKSSVMSEKVISDLLHFVEENLNSPSLKLLNVSWYGGEPLLQIDTILYLSKQFKSMCKKKKIEYHADILTNGFLLTKELAEILSKKCNVVDVQIPMDGMSESYSKRKGVSPLVFDTVVKNINDISKYMNVHIRMNIDTENKDEIKDLTKLLLIDKNLKERIRVYLAPVKNYENVCDFKGESCFSNKDFFEYRNEYYKFLYELGVKNSIFKAIPAPRWISCGLSQVNNLVIDPEGNFYRCAHLIGHRDSVIGNVSIGQVFNPVNMEYLNVNYAHKCLDCKLFPICMGGCVFERLLNNDDPVCRETFDRLRNDLSLAYNYLA